LYIIVCEMGNSGKTIKLNHYIVLIKIVELYLPEAEMKCKK
jgi:hypothetical protein